MEDIFLEKSEIRKSVRADIKAFCEKIDDKLAAEKKICEAIINSEAFKKAGMVLSYNALFDEADISPVIEEALKFGKKVGLPVVEGSDMNFYEVNASSHFMEGAFGISEPEASPENLISSDLLLQNTLILVPGRAFTKDGKRLGRGKGFYDRWFYKMGEASEKMEKWGICFSCQLVNNLPCDNNDVLMDKIIHQ